MQSSLNLSRISSSVNRSDSMISEGITIAVTSLACVVFSPSISLCRVLSSSFVSTIRTFMRTMPTLGNNFTPIEKREGRAIHSALLCMHRLIHNLHSLQRFQMRHHNRIGVDKRHIYPNISPQRCKHLCLSLTARLSPFPRLLDHSCRLSASAHSP